MATILTVLRRVEAVDTDKICVESVQESKEVLADLNAEQINSGIRSDGTLMPDYSFRSVFQYGKQPGPIRLRETGAWQAGLYVKVEGNKVVFGSSDSKDQQLVDRYGPEIEGLSEKFKAEAMREKVRPVFKSKIEAATGLKFN